MKDLDTRDLIHRYEQMMEARRARQAPESDEWPEELLPLLERTAEVLHTTPEKAQVVLETNSDDARVLRSEVSRRLRQHERFNALRSGTWARDRLASCGSGE